MTGRRDVDLDFDLEPGAFFEKLESGPGFFSHEPDLVNPRFRDGEKRIGW